MGNLLSSIFFQIASGTPFRSVSDGVSEITETAGVGNPEGVIAANPGSRYIDYSSGIIWTKSTGTGNSGWEQTEFYVHPNHTGAVESDGDGAMTIAQGAVGSAAIPDGELSNLKLANVGSPTIKGRLSLDSGQPEDLDPSQVRTLLNVEDGANNYTHPNHTGDVTSTGDGTTVIANNAVINSKIQDGTILNSKISDNSITAAKIASGTIGNQEIASMPGGSVMARLAGSGTGPPQNLTGRQMRGALRIIRNDENFASTINWDIEDGIQRRLLATGNFTLNFPSNVIPGETAIWVITSGAGTPVITLGPGYQTPAGHSIILSGAGKKDILHMFFDTRFTCTVIITKDVS